MKLWGIVGLLLLTSMALRAQDQHFSLLDLDPMLFNPAYSGFFEGSQRYGLIYRNQWASVSVPFQTLTATAEWGLARSARNGNGFSAALWATADRAGSLSYGATSISGVVSYFQAIGEGDDLISIAAEAGAGQVGFNPANLDLTDPTETLPQTTAFYPTFGAGVAWFREWNSRLYTKLGLSMRNINQPNISFMQGEDSRLARKWNAYARAEWRYHPQWSIMPVVGYQHQGMYSELIYGADVRWYFDEHPQTYLVFSGGLLMRHADAASLNLAVLWREWTFAFSYDANISRLTRASHTLGSFELGIVYLIGRKDQRRPRALPCPII